MQYGSSTIKRYCITLTEFIRARKRAISCFVIVIFIFVFALAPFFVLSARKSVALNWSDGWNAWKDGQVETALQFWSKDTYAADISPRPARLLYWRIRALEKLGREEEALSLKVYIAKKYPFDFYTFLFFPQGGALVSPRGDIVKIKSLFFPRPWKKLVMQVSKFTGVSEEMIWAIMKRESKFRTDAISPCGAVGLMQLMPATAKAEALSLNIDDPDVYLPEHNILLGANHFSRLIKKFGGDIPRAVAAYNAGMTSVMNWDTLSANDWVEWIEEIPYPETREFVRSVLENREFYRIMSGEDDSTSLFLIGKETPISLEKVALAVNEARELSR